MNADPAPFDVTTIPETDDPLQAFIDRRDRRNPAPKITGLVAPRDFGRGGPPQEHDPEVAPEPIAGPADASQDRDPLLAERQSTHGSFTDNAILSQAIKSIMRASPGWAALTDIEREAMDMIALKFSRILSGKSMQKQHWEDVVGYGKLVEEQCV